MKHDIETALKMLDARGGDLDKEAARIIRKLRTLPFGSNPVERGLTREDISEMMYAAKLAAAQAELRAAHQRITKLEDEKAAADGWKPRYIHSDGKPHSWAEYDLYAARELMLAALEKPQAVRACWRGSVRDGEVHALASELRIAHDTLKTEHRGALRELGEVVAKLGKELREHEGDFDGTDTALLLADEAAQEIRMLRCWNSEKQARIDKLMDRQQGLMNAVVDAQHERGAFAPDHPSRQPQPDVSYETSRDDLDYLKMEAGPLTIEKIESWPDRVQRKIAEKKAVHAFAQALTRAGVKVEE